MGASRVPLFSGLLASSTTTYIGVPVHSGCIGIHIGWPDATSNATITLELSSYPSEDAAVATAGTADLWSASGVTITGPNASARGAALVNVDNCRQRRARLKIVTTANSTFAIYDGVDAVI